MPIENAIYWVEHVTRHQGAAYLKSAAQRLNWWQYHNVDVLLIIFVVMVLLLIVLPITIYKLLKKLLLKGERTQSTKVKRN